MVDDEDFPRGRVPNDSRENRGVLLRSGVVLIRLDELLGGINAGIDDEDRDRAAGNRKVPPVPRVADKRPNIGAEDAVIHVDISERGAHAIGAGKVAPRGEGCRRSLRKVLTVPERDDEALLINEAGDGVGIRIGGVADVADEGEDELLFGCIGCFCDSVRRIDIPAGGRCLFSGSRLAMKPCLRFAGHGYVGIRLPITALPDIEVVTSPLPSVLQLNEEATEADEVRVAGNKVPVGPRPLNALPLDDKGLRRLKPRADVEPTRCRIKSVNPGLRATGNGVAGRIGDIEAEREASGTVWGLVPAILPVRLPARLIAPELPDRDGIVDDRVAEALVLDRICAEDAPGRGGDDRSAAMPVRLARGVNIVVTIPIAADKPLDLNKGGLNVAFERGCQVLGHPERECGCEDGRLELKVVHRLLLS